MGLVAEPRHRESSFWARVTARSEVTWAGVSRRSSARSSAAEVTGEEFDTLVDVHFKGVFFLTQRLLDQLADGGAIVNLSSGLARFSYPKRIAYGSVKGAVEVLSRYLAAELGPRGIRVNVVARRPRHPAMQEAIASNTALGRPPSPMTSVRRSPRSSATTTTG